MKKIFLFACVTVLSVALVSCKKKTEEPADDHDHVHTAEPGTLQVEFENNVNGNPLVFGTNYVNANLDTFKVSMFKYYISNVVLTKDDNTTYVQPESYFLVDHSTSTVISIPNVPAGSYKSIKFTLGVDSARNSSGAQTGALDPAKGMFWSWSSGYIMLKMEGTSPKSPDANKKLMFHVGGYGGVNASQRNFNLSFNGATANISSTTSSMVHLKVNLNELFTTPQNINFATTYVVHMPGATAKTLADNYANMITFDHVHN